MKIFISWSGQQSAAVASALKNWLPFIFQSVNVWMSGQDIQAGTKWGVELGKALSECKLGIVCLTPESLESRWLAFEAGALSTAISDSRVIPYRFQVNEADVGPPLSQFQSVGADKEGTFKLIQSINNALGEPWQDDEKMRLIFQKLWPELNKDFNAAKRVVPTQIRSDRDLLEEILDLSRQAGIRDLSALLMQVLSVPNVRRVEVAPKQIAGTITNRLALRITVAKKLSLAEIPKDQMIPSSIFGMPTDVVEDTLLL